MSLKSTIHTIRFRAVKGNADVLRNAMAPEPGALLDAVLISDTHLTDEYKPAVYLLRAMRNLECLPHRPDVLAITGDCTNRGKAAEHDLLAYILRETHPAGQVLPVMGNHDTGLVRAESDGFPTHLRRFLQTLNLCVKTDRQYYAAEAGGFTWIALAPESDVYEDNQDITDAQLGWFEQTMDAAAEQGKPVIVLSHYALNHTHHIETIWPAGELGPRSDDVLAILKKHAQLPVFYITGHIHNFFDVSGIERHGNLTLVDVPCFGRNNIYFAPGDTEMKTELRREEKGLGYRFLLYPDRAELRAMNFLTGKRYPMYDQTAAL